MGRKAQVEATYEFFGGFSTLLSADVAAGATQVETAEALTAGQTIEIDVSETAQGGSATAPDVAIVESVTGAGPCVVTLGAPLAYAHSSGAIVSPLRTSPSSVFADLKTVIRGEPFEMLDDMHPVLYITVPQSHEYREYAQKKFIDYTVTCVLVWLMSSEQQGDQGNLETMVFYNLLDQIAGYVRSGGTGNPSDAKILKTKSYPDGASIRFGEDFTVEEIHERVENSTFLVARLQIGSREQVNG